MLKKLSLAALVAMGSMSLASATPLTEAIKNVDLSGMLRIRFYNEKPENSNNYTMWRTNGVFIFKIPVAENINFVFRNSTQSFITHTESNDQDISTISGGDITKAGDGVDSTMVNNLLFMNYHQDGLNAIAGKIPVATPITSVDAATPTHGAGAIATYSFGNGFTGAAGFVTAMKNAGYNDEAGSGYIGQAINNDVYVLAGIYGNDAIKAQAWYFHVENLLKYDVIASADLDLLKLANMQNNYDVQFHVDYAASKLDDAAANSLKVSANTKNYWNVNVKGTVAGAALRVGYAKSSDDIGVITVGGADSALTANEAHTANNYDIINSRNTKMWYADASYNVTSALKLTAAFSSIDADKNANDPLNNTYTNDVNDYTLQADYAYNKKLSFQAYYDYADVDAPNSDNTEVRLQALYKF